MPDGKKKKPKMLLPRWKLAALRAEAQRGMERGPLEAYREAQRAGPQAVLDLLKTYPRTAVKGSRLAAEESARKAAEAKASAERARKRVRRREAVKAKALVPRKIRRIK